MKNQKLIRKLLDILRKMEGASTFFASVLAKGGSNTLMAEEGGFRLEFENGDYVQLSEKDGAIFAAYGGKHGANSNRVDNQNAARSVYEEVLEELTAPVLA